MALIVLRDLRVLLSGAFLSILIRGHVVTSPRKNVVWCPFFFYLFFSELLRTSERRPSAEADTDSQNKRGENMKKLKEKWKTLWRSRVPFPQIS